MIGYIKGKIIGKNEQSLLLENNGIGYRVFSTPQVLTIDIGQEIELHTHLQVREDAFNLFGFQSAAELAFFELLTTVSGVGPKTAFTVISALKTEEIIQAVTSNEVDALTKVPGLGRKTAMKIILELSTKFKSGFDMKNMVLSDDDQTVISALVSLGYKSYDAKKIVSKLPKNLTVEEKIKEALKKNSK